MTKKDLLERIRDVPNDVEIALDNGVTLLYDFHILNALDGEDDTPVVVITE